MEISTDFIIIYGSLLDDTACFGTTFFKKNNGWFFEYDFDGKVYSEKVEVKF